MQSPKQRVPDRSVVSPIQPQTLTGGVQKEVIDKQLIGNVNKVFTTLKITYPAWYEKYYGDQKSERLAKRIWITGIKTLTNAQVDHGLQRMVIESEYPPKLKDFIALCTGTDDLPNLEVAWYEALSSSYSHPVVKIAAQLTGIFELRRSGYDNSSLKRRFEYYLSQVVKRFIEGKTLTEVAAALETTPLLVRVEQEAEQRVMERIKEQGINLHNAREQCLAKLGIKRS